MNPDLINLARKALRVAHAERESAMAEYRRLYARLERLADTEIKRLAGRPRRLQRGPALHPLEGGLSQAEREKIKSGRPGIWRSLEGFLLVRAVEQIQAENESYGVARAIRKAIKTDPILKDCKPMRRISDRALQARYQQALEYWEPALENELHKKWTEARERVKETFKRIDVLAGLVDELQDRARLSVTKNDFV